MASGLKTALWTGAAIAAASVVAFSSIVPLFSLGGAALVAGAAFAGYKAWQSHKENQMEAQVEEARIVYATQQQGRAMAYQQEYDNGMGSDQPWTERVRQGRSAGYGR